MLLELTSALEDGTVFEIVHELESIQQLSERKVLNQRMKVVSNHKQQMAELGRKQLLEGSSSNREEEKKILEKRLADELRYRMAYRSNFSPSLSPMKGYSNRTYT